MNKILNDINIKSQLEKEELRKKCNIVASKLGMQNYLFEKEEDEKKLFIRLIDIFLNYDEEMYFKTKECRYIFALVELDTELRSEMLGITLELYENSVKAKRWYNSIAKIIHPDISKHPNAKEAMSKLNELYEGMKQDGK